MKKMKAKKSRGREGTHENQNQIMSGLCWNQLSLAFAAIAGVVEFPDFGEWINKCRWIPLLHDMYLYLFSELNWLFVVSHLRIPEGPGSGFVWQRTKWATHTTFLAQALMNPSEGLVRMLTHLS